MAIFADRPLYHICVAAFGGLAGPGGTGSDCVVSISQSWRQGGKREGLTGEHLLSCLGDGRPSRWEARNYRAFAIAMGVQLGGIA